MTQETIVAAFDSAAQADDAARAVEAAGIPAANITQHAGTSAEQVTTSDVTPAHKERGFWARLFGDDEDDNYAHESTTMHDHSVYDKTMAGGGSVLSVKVDNVERDGDRILDIMESHNPIDIEERATGYAATGTTSATPMASGASNDTQTIQLAEEALVVGRARGQSWHHAHSAATSSRLSGVRGCFAATGERFDRASPGFRRHGGNRRVYRQDDRSHRDERGIGGRQNRQRYRGSGNPQGCP